MKRYKETFKEELAKIDDKDKVDINPRADEPLFQTPRVTPQISQQLESLRNDFAYVLDKNTSTALESKLSMKDWSKCLKENLDIHIPHIGLAYALMEKFEHFTIRKKIGVRKFWDNNMAIDH